MSTIFGGKVWLQSISKRATISRAIITLHSPYIKIKEIVESPAPLEINYINYNLRSFLTSFQETV